MKCAFLFVFAIVVSSALFAQTEAAKNVVIANDSLILDKVEVESAFPGGAAAWSRFLANNLVYPPKAIRKKIEGTVIVQFIVDKTGAISDIEAINGPELLQEAAVNVIKQSPNWKPAFQNGRKVKSYKKQPITFKLQ